MWQMIHTYICFRTYKQKRNAGTLDTGKAVPQASSFSHFFEEGHHGEFSVIIRFIDGAQDVYSLRRRIFFGNTKWVCLHQMA